MRIWEQGDSEYENMRLWVTETGNMRYKRIWLIWMNIWEYDKYIWMNIWDKYIWMNIWNEWMKKKRVNEWKWIYENMMSKYITLIS